MIYYNFDVANHIDTLLNYVDTVYKTRRVEIPMHPLYDQLLQYVTRKVLKIILPTQCSMFARKIIVRYLHLALILFCILFSTLFFKDQLFDLQYE